MAQRLGKRTLVMDNPPSIAGYASVVGKKEGEGPLFKDFDLICEDTALGEKTWEKAESRLQKDAVNKALSKSALSSSDIDYIFAGDLLNQCIGTTYGLRDLQIPLLGVFGACSTMAEALGLSSVFVDGNVANNCIAVTSSHFCTAERQFRFPLEYGGQRTPTAQWTVTGSGAIVVSKSSIPPYLKEVTFGMIEDLGIKDANNMGAAMAPAAASTIKAFFDDTTYTPDDFDLILTGDLGSVGSQLLIEILNREGLKIEKQHNDCGMLIYDRRSQDVHAGGSGCGCSASVLCSYILNRMKGKDINDILFVATGALMSTTSVQQGESIPSVAHLVHISNYKSQKC